MKKTLLLSAFLLIGTAASQAVTVIVDNYFTQPNGSTVGAVGDFAVQSFTPTVAGLGINDTVAANTPYTGATATVSLNSVSFIRATSGSSFNAGLGVDIPTQTFIHIYLGAGNGGTYVGSSTNSIDTDAAAGLSTMTWNFNNLALASPGSQHAFVFTNSATSAPGTTNYHARLQVARDAGGNFNSSYSGGTADDTINNSSPSAFDSRFEVSMTAIPELSLAGWAYSLCSAAAARHGSHLKEKIHPNLPGPPTSGRRPFLGERWGSTLVRLPRITSQPDPINLISMETATRRRLPVSGYLPALRTNAAKATAGDANAPACAGAPRTGLQNKPEASCCQCQP